MPYSAEISSGNPALFGFLIDQSTSMKEKMAGGGGIKKSKIVADYIDKFFDGLITRNISGERIKNRFDIFALGYGRDENDNKVYSVLNGWVMDKPPLNLETLDSAKQARTVMKKVIKKEPDGAGGIIEKTTEVPETVNCWINERFAGDTPMEAAFREAYHIINDWTQKHQNSFPPILINVTDGAHNEGEKPEDFARDIRNLRTSDGEVLVFNVYIAEEGSNEPSIKFPSRSDFTSPDQFAQKLFMMSSNVPKEIRDLAVKRDKSLQEDAVGFGCNVDFNDFYDFLDIGTRPAA